MSSLGMSAGPSRACPLGPRGDTRPSASLAFACPGQKHPLTVDGGDPREVEGLKTCASSAAQGNPGSVWRWSHERLTNL